jgi:hypothetical protein
MTAQLTATDVGGPALAQAGLTFHRSVDRVLLHRSALSEVFLTDCRAVDDHTYLAAAQVPPSHAFYTDHLHRSPLVDPMLLMECARQAETYGGHAVLGVPAGTSFILRDWSLRVDDPAALTRPPGPAEVTMVVETRDHRRVGGALRGVVYDIGLSLEGEPVGRVHISVGYLSSETYQRLRVGRRGSVPPVSTSVHPRPAGAPVAPHLVGRRDPGNVVLMDARTAGGELTARIRPAVDNPSLFDHAQDHLPGMVMVEAARQAGLLALNDLHGLSPYRWVLTGMRAEFSSYAELDAPAFVRVRPRVPAHHTDRLELTAEFEQDSTVIAEAVLTMAMGG